MPCGCSQGNLPMSGGGVSLAKRTKTELYELAKKYKIRGRSTMKKAELVSAIRAKHAEIGQLLSRRRK